VRRACVCILWTTIVQRMTLSTPSPQDKEVFLYQLQRRFARRAWLVPFSEFCRVMKLKMEVILICFCSLKASREDICSHVLFVHSTGRCGSTLLSKVLRLSLELTSKMIGVMGGFASLSEPDVFSSLVVHHKLHPDVVRLSPWHVLKAASGRACCGHRAGQHVAARTSGGEVRGLARGNQDPQLRCWHCRHHPEGHSDLQGVFLLIL
jgi:hypothetical protein